MAEEAGFLVIPARASRTPQNHQNRHFLTPRDVRCRAVTGLRRESGPGTPAGRRNSSQKVTILSLPALVRREEVTKVAILVRFLVILGDSNPGQE